MRVISVGFDRVLPGYPEVAASRSSSIRLLANTIGFRLSGVKFLLASYSTLTSCSLGGVGVGDCATAAMAKSDRTKHSSAHFLIKNFDIFLTLSYGLLTREDQLE